MSRGTLDPGPLAMLFAYKALTFFGLSSQTVQLSIARFLPVLNPCQVSLTGLGSTLFARRYFGYLV